MKTQLIQTVVAAFTLAAAGYAQNPQKTIKVTVPFDFAVGSRVLPAGQYAVSQDLRTRTLMIRSAAGADVYALADQVASPGRREIAKLVFHRYGDRYFLSEAWGTDEERGSQLPETAQERKLAQNLREAPATRIIAAR